MLSVLVRLEAGLHTPPARILPIMNTKKSRFLTAVRILALDDPSIIGLAQCVAEADLPEFPGAAALLFVTRLSNSRKQKSSTVDSLSFPRGVRKHSPCRHSLTRMRTVPSPHPCPH